MMCIKEGNFYLHIKYRGRQSQNIILLEVQFFSIANIMIKINHYGLYKLKSREVKIVCIDEPNAFI